MKRADLVAVVTAIIVSSCAASDDVSAPDDASGGSAVIEETVGSEGEAPMTRIGPGAVVTGRVLDPRGRP